MCQKQTVLNLYTVTAISMHLQASKRYKLTKNKQEERWRKKRFPQSGLGTHNIG